MKMETVIRSPQKGVIAKLVHKEGVSEIVSAKANTANIE
jgi:biotin carboxyl carrier protein